MKNIHLHKTDKSPQVILSKQLNHMRFSGISRLEENKEFYQPIIDWLVEYKMLMYFLSHIESQNKEINVEFEFEYFDSSSAKYLHNILKEFKEISTFSKINLKICWIYDPQDLDMLESGLNFQEMLCLPFKFILANKLIHSN